MHHFSSKCSIFIMPVYHLYSTDLRPDFVPNEIHAAHLPIRLVETRFCRRMNADEMLHGFVYIKLFTQHV